MEGPDRLASIDLNLLSAFDALMAERSVTLAASRVGVKQPALSSALSRLRRLFDDPLFVREGGRLVPTPLAESVSRPIADALAAAQAVVDARQSFDASTDVRTFTVLVSDYVTVTLLHPLLAQLDRLAPRIAIDLRPVSADFVDRVRRGQADLVIVPSELAGSTDGLRMQALFTDRNVCVIDAARTDVGDTLGLDELRSSPLLTYEGGALAALSASDLGRRSLDRDLDVSTQSFMVGAFMVAGTKMIALMPLRLAQTLAEAAQIRVVETSTQLPPFVETMFWSDRTSGDPAHRWLREQIAVLADGLGP